MEFSTIHCITSDFVNAIIISNIYCMPFELILKLQSSLILSLKFRVDIIVA